MADTQGGTTAEGIHLGAMAGTIDLLQRGYSGLAARGGMLTFDPRSGARIRRSLPAAPASSPPGPARAAGRWQR
jgi:trehalose/maltose hydrolase-like predicted phosphorylase